MNIFTIFFYKILAKYSSKRTIKKKILGGAYPRTPLANAWLRHTLHERQANTPTFPKTFWTLPQNELPRYATA